MEVADTAGTSNPRRARPWYPSETISRKSSLQSPSERDIERLAQLPKEPANSFAAGRSTGRTGNPITPSIQKQQNPVTCDYRETYYKQRDDISSSSTWVLARISELLEFVKKQSGYGRQTLMNVLDLQDMKEEWLISQGGLSGSMHSHRAAVRDRRDIMKVASGIDSAQESNKVNAVEHARLRKLLMLKAAMNQSRRMMFMAANHLENFQRRRGLRPYTSRLAAFKTKPSLYVLSSNLTELSELIEMQFAKLHLNEVDPFIARFRHSLGNVLNVIYTVESMLEGHKRRRFAKLQFRQKEHIRSLQYALWLASSRSSYETDLDEEAFQRTVEAAEASTDGSSTQLRHTVLRYGALEQLDKCNAGITASSGEGKSMSRPPSERNESYTHYCELLPSDDSSLGCSTRGTPMPNNQTVEASTPGQAFHQLLVPPRPEPPLGESPQIIGASDRPERSEIRRVRSQVMLGESSIMELHPKAAARRMSLPHSRIANGGGLKFSPSQKFALHCASSLDPASAVEPDLPSTLPVMPNSSSCSPLGFRITDTVLESVSRLDQNTTPMHWDYALYRGPLGEKVKVHYCKSKADTERIARLFFDEEVLGFDIEWKPNATANEGIKKNVALIQIASEKRIALFHIARFRGEDSVDNLVTPTFKWIMQSPRITKVGVSIKADCTRLRRFMGIESRGLFELSHLHKLVKHSASDAGSINKRLVRLATQVEEHLGLPLWKGQDVRSSDWSVELNYQQVQYAASDSYAGFQLYHAMEHKRKSLDPTPPRPYHAELNLPIRLSSGQAIETDDEQPDIEEDTPTGDPECIEELARDFLKIKIADPPLPPTPKQSKRPPKTPPKEPTAEFTKAQEWATTWRGTLPADYKPAASPASLRAYALWHEQKCSVPEAAAFLRDPPLQNATVAVYVIDALTKERLPFEKERLAALLVHVPQAAKARYRKFIMGCGLEVV